MLIAYCGNRPIYSMSAEEYIDMRKNHKEQFNKDSYYMIHDKRKQIIHGDFVVGQLVGKTGPVKIFSERGPSWRKFLGVSIENIVITERPTIEKMVTEGSQRLKEVLDEAPIAQANAEVKLNELVNESNQAVEKVVAEGEAIRKSVSTRKRSNPISKKRTINKEGV